MQLYLIRHAIAVDSDSAVATHDGQHALTEVGVEKMRKHARALKRLGVEFTVLLTSPLLRARQTAEILAEVLRHGDRIETCDALAPGGDPDGVIDVLRPLETASRVGVVGHNPDLEELATMLISGQSTAGIAFRKGGICRIDITSFSPSPDGQLVWHLTPKLLRALAG